MANDFDRLIAKRLRRRDFMRYAGIAAGAGVLASCKKATSGAALASGASRPPIAQEPGGLKVFDWAGYGGGEYYPKQEVQVFTDPYKAATGDTPKFILFANDDEYTRISKGPVGQWLFQKLVPKGITGLAFWDNGFHMVSANRPLIAPADFQGLKFRISGSKIADQYFRLMGGLPQILAFSEVYQALQTGVVDGCENTPSNYLTQKFYEVQKHVSAANHAHLQYAVIVNTKFWTGLPADIRGQLDQAMNEATDYTNSIARKENEDAMAAIEGSGKTTIHVLTEPQRQAWKTKMMPAYDWAKGRVGKEVLDLLSKAMDTKTN